MPQIGETMFGVIITAFMFMFQSLIGDVLTQWLLGGGV